MVDSLLSLEPSWSSVKVGDKVDLLVEMVIFDPGFERHLVRTAVRRNFITIKGCLSKEAIAHSILGAEVISCQKGF